jgi:TonB-linked SusC/RagA family outer membrane protein
MKTKLNGFLTLLLALMVQITFAQEKTVTGKVSDASGPLPGVTVIIKGTKTGTQTDFDGKYSIRANTGAVLQFSFVGMKTVSQAVGASNIMNIVMQEDAESLEEVVINALGVQVARASKASSVSNVDGVAISNSGETSVLTGLSGKASGVSITQSSGDPGASAYVQIRGQTSITRSLQPLFVVDGIPMNNDELGNTTDGVSQQSRMNDISPNDIASVKILKGASAAALWGSRAANGVILITTKTGRKSEEGSFNVSVYSKMSFDKASLRYPLQSIYGRGTNGAGATSTSTQSGSWGDKISARPGGADIFATTGAYFETEDGTKYYAVTQKNSTENFEDSNYNSVFGNGGFLETGATITAGTKTGSYFASISKLDQDGIIGGGDGNSSYTRYNARFNSELKVTENLDLKSNFAYSNVNSNRIQTGSNLSGLLLGLYRTPADFDQRDYKGTRYDANGVPNFNSHRSYRRQLGTTDRQSPSYNNPLWTINEQKNPNEVNRFVSGLELKYKANDWLTFIAKTGLDHYTDDKRTYFPLESAENAGSGSASESLTTFDLYNVDFMASAFRNIGDDITGDFLLGTNFNQRKYTQRGGSYINFILDSDKFFYTNALIEDRNSFIQDTKTRTSALYGSANFDYKSLLFLNLTGRVEKASTFGAGKTFFYPSAEFAFSFTELEGLRENDFLSSGKLRLAVGQVGQEPAAYATDNYFAAAAGGDSYGPAYDAAGYDGSFVRSTTLGNPDLRPEITTEYEVGLDLKLLKNRVNLSATYYQNFVKDALFTTDIAASTGFAGIYTNAGELENKGVELELGLDILKTDNFKWNIFGTWNTNDNVVTNIAGTESIFLAGFQGSSSRAVVGEGLGTLWGGRWDRDAAGKLILDSNGFPTVAPTEGVIGDPNPDWRGGIGTIIEYKGIKLSALFDASIGGDAWDGTDGALTNFGRSMITANESTSATALTKSDGSTQVANTPFRGNIYDFGGGNVALTQSWYQGLGSGFGPVGEQFIKDATWVKFREISLSYTINSTTLANTGVNSVELSLTGRNLKLWTKADWGQDPESNLTGASNGRGLQYFNHPTTKSYLASIKINF